MAKGKRSSKRAKSGSSSSSSLPPDVSGPPAGIDLGRAGDYFGYPTPADTGDVKAAEDSQIYMQDTCDVHPCPHDLQHIQAPTRPAQSKSTAIAPGTATKSVRKRRMCHHCGQPKPQDGSDSESELSGTSGFPNLDDEDADAVDEDMAAAPDAVDASGLGGDDDSPAVDKPKRKTGKSPRSGRKRRKKKGRRRSQPPVEPEVKRPEPFHVLVVLGGPAAGKLTVARHIGNQAGYKVFHNHLVVDMLTAVFDFASQPFCDLREPTWLNVISRAVTGCDAPGLVFTLCPETTLDQSFLVDLHEEVTTLGGRVSFVELECPPEVVLQRLDTDDRKTFSKLVDKKLYQTLVDKNEFASNFLFLPKGVELRKFSTQEDAPDRVARLVCEATGTTLL